MNAENANYSANEGSQI